MNTIYLFVICALLALGSSSTVAQDMPTIKGWTLGQSPETACRGEPATHMQDLIREAGIQDIETFATSCEVKVDSVSGVTVSEPARLLFWRGALIRVSIDFGWLDLEALAAVRGTLLETYGKPSTRRSNPFITDSWHGKSMKIELERTDRLPSNVGLYLTDKKGWTEYERVTQRITERIEAQMRLARKNDLKN